MDVQSISAVIGVFTAAVALFVKVFDPVKAWREHRDYRIERLIADAEHAHKIAERFPNDSELKRLAKQRAAASLTPGLVLTHEQREILLSLPDAEDAIKAITARRGLLVVSVETKGLAMSPGLDTDAKRLHARVGYLLGYVVFVVLAFAPTGAHIYLRGNAPMSLGELLLQALFMPFIFLALRFLYLGTEITAAQRALNEHADRLKRLAVESRTECIDIPPVALCPRFL